ncbi:MAG: hypothetical protein Q4B58_00210 [Bacteroidales bacterium]|nr:hypothetical protein [Bacteroidales bacterium]
MDAENKSTSKLKKRHIALLLALLSVTSAVCMYMFKLSYDENKRALAAQCDQYSAAQRDNIIHAVEHQMDKVEIAATNIRTSILSNLDKYTQDTLAVYEAFEHVLDRNPQISGIIAGFEDVCYPSLAKSNGFVPLIRRTDSTYTRMNLGRRDARNTNAWYQFHLHCPNDQGLWSDPFMSDDSIPITCFSLPIFDENKNFIGGIAFDLDLLDVANSIDHLKPYPSSSLVMVDKKLRIMAHPNREYILRWTLPQAMRRIGIDPDLYPLENAVKRISGRSSVKLGSQQTEVFYGPIPETNWTALLYIPQDVVYDQLADLRNTLIVVFCIGLLIIVISVIGILYLYLHHPGRKQSDDEENDEIQEIDDDRYLKV